LIYQDRFRGGILMGFDKRLLSVCGLFVCLFLFCIVRNTFGAGKEDKVDEVKFSPGAEVRIDDDSERIGGGHFLVYVPSDYTQQKAWPVIFCYHGQSGQPTTWPFRQVTDGKGFIVIGMGYAEGGEGKMTRSQYINYVKRERRSILEVVRYVRKRLRIDEERMFVTGYSKGGWHSSLMLESSPRVWAGAVIFAAGRSRYVNLVTSAANKEALQGKAIYIGAGEKDVNMSAARKATTYYRRLGAEVTFEEFKGKGHSFDPAESEILRDWLVTNSSVKDTSRSDEEADAD
jgi:predicted esterase